MEIIEWETTHKPSDWVSAALAYRKDVGDTKRFKILASVIIVLLGISILPFFLIEGLSFLICIPSRTCSSVLIWEIFRLNFCLISLFMLPLLIINTNILYRLRIEFLYRRLFIQNKANAISNKVIANGDGITVYEQTHKTLLYWNSFEHLIETENAFILSPKRNFFVLILKRDLKSLEKITGFREMVHAINGKKIKFVR